MINILNRHKSLIWLNGCPPSHELFDHINIHVPIIASDGAAHNLTRYGLTATYIVGDGDSLDHSHAQNFIHTPDQNFTDCEKSIMFAQQHHLTPSLIVGASGGELDHTLGNMQAIVKHTHNNDLFFLDTYTDTAQTTRYKIGIPLSSNYQLSIPPNTTISLITFNDACVSSKGLEWELDQHQFTSTSTLGIRNKNKHSTVRFTLHNGRILLIAEIFPSSSHKHKHNVKNPQHEHFV